MQISIPEIKEIEHEVNAKTLLEALRGAVTGTLMNVDNTPSTIDVFDLMEQHKDAILAEQKENNEEFEKTVVFAITAKILSAERITKFLDLIESWGLPLKSRYLLISMNLIDQTAFEYLAKKQISVLDQPPALLNIFKNDAQLLYILNQIQKNPEYTAAHASDINNLLRSTNFEAESVKVAFEILKVVSDKVKNVNIKNDLLAAAVKADKVLCEKYFPAPEKTTPAPAPAPVPAPAAKETEEKLPAGSTIVPEKTEIPATKKVETIHETLARLEATLAAVTKKLADKSS